MAAPVRFPALTFSGLRGSLYNLTFLRYASRKAKRERKLIARRERLLARQTNPWSQKSALLQQQKFREAALLRKNKLTPTKWPLIPDVPQDDVWLSSLYLPQEDSIEDALAYLRQLNDKSMLDNEDAFLHLRLDLDMHLGGNKYLDNVKGMIRIPRYFSEGESLRVVALSEDKEQQTKAVAAGATFTAGSDIVEKLESGTLNRDDFDMVVCMPDVVPAITPFKKQFKNAFPTVRQGSIGEDLGAVVDKFLHGKYYKVRVPLDDAKEWGVSDLVVGQLNMPTAHIAENITSYVQAISKHKPPERGPFITSASLQVENQNEEVTISVQKNEETAYSM